MSGIPPMAERRPHRMEIHGHARVDDYYWLRERENPDVIAYLEAENAYTDSILAHTKELQETLFEEIVGRLDPTDMSVPYELDGFFYYGRFEEGKEYPLFCRREGSMESAEQILLDGPRMAEGKPYFAIGGRAVSWSHNLLAYAVDYVGRRMYTIRIRDLSTGKDLPEEIELATGSMAWAADDEHLFYVRMDPETLRGFQVWRHRVGTAASADELVYEETDDTFVVGVDRTKSREYLLIGSYHKIRSEFRYLRADDPDGTFEVFLPRSGEHEYYVDHFRDHFYVTTNADAKNFRLMRCPVERTDFSSWEEVIPHRDDVLIEDVEIFHDDLVLAERSDGLVRLRIIPWDGAEEHYVEFEEPAYDVGLSANPSFESKLLRFDYASMTTPHSVFDYNMETRERILLKRQRVLGDFDSSRYISERIHATAPDGASIPISIVHRRDFVRNGSAPLLLYGYGSYGNSIDAGFSPSRISLLDRGFAFAIAHIRGGQELGRSWYDDGRMGKKKNTFTDFIACAEELLSRDYTSSDRIYAYGGSAGGLLIGAVINERPDLFHGCIAAVPFVDVVTTMLDDTIPLTTGEYDEWGNPHEAEAYEYMLSYSPYDNVGEMDYPHLLITTGLHDSQVQYWEPAKWVAKLRILKRNENRLLMHTNMEAGHGGASGRFEQFREVALQYAFLLDLAGLAAPSGMM
ncbi:MAG: S9 family peptidase [Candidatus Eisenbacteria bacterium]|uniref:S9 family peptidase n=1 Tax=Eiseniibacteriota bacterium TaxID=2212470 RepID=A0A956NBE7_UNCEI|nr:S9 family peptidase [Candidatus Eisenbacteria bacterium]